MRTPQATRLPLLVAVACAMSCLLPVCAQSAANTAAESDSLEEVIVTAQKRAERLQDVPASITALTGEMMEKRRVTSLTDLVQYTPNLHRENRASSVALTADVQLTQALKIISISSLDTANFFSPEDSDGSSLHSVISLYTARVHQLAQDLRVTSTLEGPFNFITGLYFNREQVFNSSVLGLYMDIDYNQDGVVDWRDCRDSLAASRINPAITVIGCRNTNSFDQRKHSYAAYTDGRRSHQSRPARA